MLDFTATKKDRKVACTSGISTTGSDAQQSGLRGRRNENTEMVKTKTNSSLHRFEHSLFLMSL